MGNALVQSATIQLKDIGGGLFGSVPASVESSGYLRFTNTRYQAATSGLMDITVERYGGSAGALSATITQSDANRSTGKYAPQPIAVSFADGEAGIKTYTFNVTTAPTDGPYWINLLLNIGPSVARKWWDSNSEIEVNNGVDVPSVDTTNYYTVGPSGDWTTLVDACLNVQAPALVYVRAGTYSDEDTLSDGQGINPKYSGNRENRIIIAAYPQESVTIDCDSSITDMTTQVPANLGFYFKTSRTVGSIPVSGWTIKGFTIKHAGIGFWTSGGSSAPDYHEYNNIEDCIIEDCGGAAGSNPAGVRYDAGRFCSIRNTKIDRIYEDGQLHLDIADNNSCIHGYTGADIAIEDNTLSNASHHIYHKQPPWSASGQKGYTIRRNLFNECYTAIRTEDNYTGRENQLSFIDIDIYHNINTYATMLEIPNRGSFYSSSGLWIYGNNCPFGIWSIGSYLDTQVYNNLITTTLDGVTFAREDNWIAPADSPYDPSDSGSWPVPGTPESTNVHTAGTITYFDYNLYTPDFKSKIAAGSATEQQNLTTIAQWQAATDPVIMPTAIAGQNSQLLDPLYDVNFRATAILPAGRFGETIGVPDSVSVGSNL